MYLNNEEKEHTQRKIEIKKFVIQTIGILIIISTFGGMDGLTSLLALIPGLTAVVLVFPFPNYHNIRTAIGELISFYTNRQRYVWRGWCSSYEFKDK